MSKVTVRAPRAVVWLTLGLVLVDGVVAAIGPLWLYALVAAAFVVAIMTVLVRWSRRMRPELRAAHPPGEPRPWVEVEWPGWTRRLAAGWIVLLGLLFVATLVLGMVAVLIERFG